MRTCKPTLRLPFLDSELQLTVELGVPPEDIIFAIAFMIAVSLIPLPYEYIDGNPIPTVLFTGQPATFHAFVFALLFAFAGAVSTISIREEFPKVGKYTRQFAVLSTLALLLILLWVIIPVIFHWLASLFGCVAVIWKAFG